MKNEKGITLITLVVTIAILTILSFSIATNVEPYIREKRRKNLETDISRLRESVLHYYADNKELPIINKYTNVTMLENIKNVNDSNEYYVIDLSKLNVELNYGKQGYEQVSKTQINEDISTILDVYIINKQSQTIYYPKGIEYSNTIHYTTNNEYTKMDITDVASYDNPYVPNGFEHTQGNWNDGYTIKEKTTGNEFIWVPCVTEQTKVKQGDNVVLFEKTTIGEKYNPTNMGLTPEQESVIQKEDESVQEIKASVEKYSGFYIAKFEAGIEGIQANNELETKTLANGSIKPLSQMGKGVWNSITKDDAIIVSKAMIDTSTGAKSTLISGECWDTTLRWITQTSNSKDENKEYDINSSGKGWYYDISNSIKHTTGYYDVNNIYDMAGNVWEWTTENCTGIDNKIYVLRGGSLTYLGNNYPAAYRIAENNEIGETRGFRVVMYK